MIFPFTAGRELLWGGFKLEDYMSTRIFEKVANENLSDHRETTPNHGFCDPGKEQKRERRERSGK